MEDSEIFARISEMEKEERRLEEAHEGAGLTADEQARLEKLEVALDQCWDLLRQRRARRKVGQDPDRATVRPESVVENYRQ
jgi:hypothetical protein